MNIPKCKNIKSPVIKTKKNKLNTKKNIFRVAIGTNEAKVKTKRKNRRNV